MLALLVLVEWGSKRSLNPFNVMERGRRIFRVEDFFL
jgi:hypothetical protein